MRPLCGGWMREDVGGPRIVPHKVLWRCLLIHLFNSTQAFSSYASSAFTAAPAPKTAQTSWDLIGALNQEKVELILLDRIWALWHGPDTLWYMASVRGQSYFLLFPIVWSSEKVISGIRDCFVCGRAKSGLDTGNISLKFPKYWENYCFYRHRVVCFCVACGLVMNMNQKVRKEKNSNSHSPVILEWKVVVGALRVVAEPRWDGTLW